MIYMKSADGSTHIVILESGNLDELKKGRPARTPDKEVVICWTADPVWLADRLQDTGGDMQKIAAFIDEAAKRPEKPPGRKPHGTIMRKLTENE